MPQQAVAQPVAPPAQQGMPQQPAMPEVTGMPAVIPVQSPSPAYNINSPSTVAIQNPAGTEAKIAALEADSSKLISQMQSDYVQKLNDFATQNKALQDQVQTLNSRMATMETQLNQLVQALTHQNQSERSEPAAVPGMEEAAPEHRISYNVQAIIPGRAWLRSDNGETVTVAEGDVVKSLGRVMKIDPYDGVVEINTGSKTVSLSYGTG
jgi:intracellular multiplication protein IcmG